MSAPKLSDQTALASGIVSAVDREKYTLPSGAVAQVMTVCKGKHLALASRIAGVSEPPGSYRFGLALVSVRALINGAPITIEDLDDMWSDDVMMLWGICMGKGGSPEPVSTSPSSESTEDSATPS